MAGLASSSTRCREERKRGGCSPLVHPPLPGTTSRRPSAGHQEVAGYPVVAIAVPDPAQVVLGKHCDVASETGFDSPVVAADGERATGGAAEPAAHRRAPVSSWIGIPRERLMTSPSPAESLRFSNRNSTVPRPRGGRKRASRRLQWHALCLAESLRSFSTRVELFFAVQPGSGAFRGASCPRVGSRRPGLGVACPAVVASHAFPEGSPVHLRNRSEVS